MPYEEWWYYRKIYISVQKMSCVCLAPVQISEVQPFINGCLLYKSLHFLGSCSAVNIVSFGSHRDVRQ